MNSEHEMRVYAKRLNDINVFSVHSVNSSAIIIIIFLTLGSKDPEG